jgi:hypothetical protein
MIKVQTMETRIVGYAKVWYVYKDFEDYEISVSFGTYKYFRKYKGCITEEEMRSLCEV